MRKFITSYNKGFHLPTSNHGMKNILLKRCKDVQELLKNEIKERKSQVALTTDAWGDSGVSSYLGVTAHYFDKNFVYRCRFLGLKKLPINHNGYVIYDLLQETIFDYGLEFSDISKIITDGASNMIKAFEDVTVGFGSKVTEGEGEEDYNDDQDSGSESDENNFDFNLIDSVEPDVELEYPYEEWCRRLSCVLHGIQRVLLLSVEKKCAQLWDIVKKARKIVKYIRKSTKAKERFYKLTNSTLLLPGDTRWNSHYFMINRFVKLVPEAEKVLKEFPRVKNPLQRITASELATLKEFGVILSTFQHAIMELQKKSITSSKTFGIIKGLMEDTSMRHVNPILDTLCTTMNSELEHRFGKFINLNHQNFDPHFVICAAFDPTEAICLNGISPERIRDLIAARLPAIPNIPNDPQIITGEAPLTYREKMLMSVQQETQSPRNKKLAELLIFISDMITGKYVDREAVMFWHDISPSLIYLQQMALSYLAIPSSSAPSEFVFSQSSAATKGLKNRTQHELLN
uniref:Transposase n=1 Tax=Panagrolaimus sp. PS1159 TaxID=55785 RepID=A0AC35GG11_9BILA